MADVLISGGIFLGVVILPYAGYKLYKKYVRGQCSAPSTFFCCCPSSSRGASTGGRGRNFIRKKIVPRVELILPSNVLRVGETVGFKVIFPLRRHRTLQIVQREPNSLPRIQESTYLEEKHDLNLLNIDVIKVSGASLASKVVPIREQLPRIEGKDEATLLVKFIVQESGFYELHIQYEDEHVPGSPFPIPFNPGEIDAEKTLCSREAPILLSALGDLMSIYIKPKDRFGNECNFGDVRPSKFHFKVKKQNEQEMEAIIFNFTREVNTKIGEEVFETGEGLEVRMDAEIFQPGMHQGIITYDGTLIQNGAFDIITLSQEEFSMLRNVMSMSNPGSKYYSAKLIGVGVGEGKKPKEVYIYVNSKTLIIKEFYLVGIIPIRVATFRILPATRIKMFESEGNKDVSKLEISDRFQPKVEMELDSASARLVTAMYAMFLKQRLGGSESFENKQKFFYDELKTEKNYIRTTTIVINIDRSNIVESTWAETRSFTAREWCRNFKIKFIGEEGSDDGGLRREWLNLLCKEFFDDSPEGMFCSNSSSRLVHPNGNRDQTKWTLKHYDLAGKVVGKCLYETAIGGYYKVMVNARFSRSFLGQLMGFTPTYKFFEQDDPELFISKVKYLLENDASLMDLTFSEDEYSSNGQLLRVVDLIPNGRKIPVTDENKEEYLNFLAQYRLSTRVKREIEAFVKGLNEIVPEGLLTNFDENELEILMCGKSQFSVEDLRLHHVVTGQGTFYDRILTWFWTAVTNMTPEERCRLLQFTTGSSLLPHGGFKDLQPQFRITVYDTFGKLPIAHTCFSEICLSIHSSYERFERALKLAINEGSEGFGRI